MSDTRTPDDLVSVASNGLVGTKQNIAANELARRLRRAEDRLAAWKAEAEAARSERAAFFSKTMNYEDWQAASKRVQDARAATDAIEKNAS